MSNRVVLIGSVAEEPHMEHGALCVNLNINRQDLRKTEQISVYTYEVDLIKKGIIGIHEGDLFVCDNAFIKTIPCKKIQEIVCSECHQIFYQEINSERTEVIFNSFSVIGKNIDFSKVNGVNKVFLEGNITSDINYRPRSITPNTSYIKYKLGINEYSYSTDANYPFIVSFGKDADVASKNLHKGSRIFLEGSIQERKFKQNVDFICPHCDCQAIKKVQSKVREVITSNVVFLDKSYNIAPPEHLQTNPKEADINGESI